LQELGYLERVPGLDKYSLGIAVVGFGQLYLGALDLREVARPLMQVLADEVKATVALAARSGDAMMFLELAHGNPTFALGVGERVPRGTSALGRACAAGWPADEREQRMEEFRRCVPPEDWHATLRAYRKAFADYEAHGLCLSLGDWNKDVYSVSVPFGNGDPNKLMAFSCSLPARAVTREHLINEVGPKLKAMRDRVAQILGH